MDMAQRFRLPIVMAMAWWAAISLPIVIGDGRFGFYAGQFAPTTLIFHAAPLVSFALIGLVVLGKDTGTPRLWRIGGVILIHLGATMLLTNAVSDLRLFDRYSYSSYRLVSSAIPIGFGLFLCLSSAGLQQARSWVVIALMTSVALCFLIDFFHFAIPPKVNPYEWTRSVPTVILAVVICIQFRQPEHTAILLCRWALGYGLCVIAIPTLANIGQTKVRGSLIASLFETSVDGMRLATGIGLLILAWAVFTRPLPQMLLAHGTEPGLD